MESVFRGTELKFAITITADNFSMENDNFSVDIVRGPNVVSFTKAELVDDGEGNYLVCFDTTDLGVGDVYAVVTAYVPDNDFSDGLRTEVYKLLLGKVMAV